MNCENINNFIHDYFDNELSTEQESFLFTHLAQCEGCKANFRALNRVQFEFRKEESEFPERLEERIFDTIRNKEHRVATNSPGKRLPTYLIYGYGVLVTIISVFMTYRFFDIKEETLDYKGTLESTITQIDVQKRQISMLINEMPAVKVRASVNNSNILKKGI